MFSLFFSSFRGKVWWCFEVRYGEWFAVLVYNELGALDRFHGFGLVLSLRLIFFLLYYLVIA